MVAADLRPLYGVTRRDFRNQHLYSIIGDDAYKDMKSVTHYTGVIEKGALGPWMVREALDGVRRELYLKLGNKTRVSVDLDIDEIEQMLERAKAKPEKVKTDAADYGTDMHAAIDVFVTTGKWPEYRKEIQPAINSFLEWWGKGRDIVLGDTYVASRKHRFGGAFDAIERRADGLWILDWKSSNGLWPEMAIQVGGGYTLAFEETYGVKPAGACIARFGKKLPEFEALDVENVLDCQVAFTHALGLRQSMAKKLYAKPKDSKK